MTPLKAEKHPSASADMIRQYHALDRRLLALEITVRGEHGDNGLKAALKRLYDRFDAFERKAIRVIAVGTALPGIVVAVVAVLRFLGKV